MNPTFGRRLLAVTLTLGCAVTLSSVLAPQSSGASVATSTNTVTKTIARTHLVNGQDVPVDSRKVSVTVGNLTNLKDLQSVNVSWTGAHPTGGLRADPNSGQAAWQEYPMVLMQCRGSDAPGTPVAQRLDPRTCWAPSSFERYQYDYSNAFPPWRVDRYAAAADRVEYPDAPSPRPARCPSAPISERFMPFRAASGVTYYGGINNCAGLPPEAAAVDGTLNLPSNTTYAPTRTDGSGSVKFNFRDAQDNASLGCGQGVACSLVVVPIMGISCDVAAAGLPDADRPAPGADATAADTACTKTGFYKPGQPMSNIPNQDNAVSGALWWSASNWQNRFSFPISFAAPDNVCDLLSTKKPVDVYGSELLIQATNQWAPKFCLDRSLTSFKHVQTGEPEARNVLASGGIESAFTSQPASPTYSKPSVHAPIAVTGFAISYVIDDSNHARYGQLNLDARLLAKLLTESYPAVDAIKQSYSYQNGTTTDTSMRNNPLDMSVDPEFIALNPGVGSTGQHEGASTVLSLASDSDVLWALTSYINADPEARSWLDGKPDPWGMTVNPTYRGISLPLNSWPQLDTFEPKAWYEATANFCLMDSPSPYLPLVASPMSRLALIGQNMQFAIQNSQTICSVPDNGDRQGEKLVARGRQAPGSRFMLGVTSLGDARRYSLDTAALQTSVTPGAPEQFTTAANRSFVQPTDDALRAAVALLQPDTTNGGWALSYDDLRTKGPTAYPGTMLVYMDTPTTGLPAADATAYSQLLNFVAGPGQTPGSTAGTLADGFLPMTDANGMAAEVKYTRAAAIAVQQQKGQIPDLTGTLPTQGLPTLGSPTGLASASGPQPGGVSASGSAGTAASAAAGGRGGGPSAAAAGRSGGAAAPLATSNVTASPPLKSLGKTSGLASGLGPTALIVLLVLILLGPLGGTALLYTAQRRAGK